MCKWTYDCYNCGHKNKRRMEICPQGLEYCYWPDEECLAVSEQYPDRYVHYPCQDCGLVRDRAQSREYYKEGYNWNNDYYGHDEY